MTDQKFTLRQILEKTQEIDTFHLFIDYNAAFDSLIRQKLLDVIAEFYVPSKLIRLCGMTLTDTKSLVKIGKHLTESFSTKRGFRQGDSLSYNLFEKIMDMIMRTAAENKTGTIFNKSHMMLAYAVDIDIIGRELRDITAAISIFEKKSAKVGLVIGEDKIKFFVSANKNSNRLGRCLNIDNYNVEVADDCAYFGFDGKQE